MQMLQCDFPAAASLQLFQLTVSVSTQPLWFVSAVRASLELLQLIASFGTQPLQFVSLVAGSLHLLQHIAAVQRNRCSAFL